VVALFVDPNGPYPRLVRDWYDEARDARTYMGSRPVVAHPACGPWGRLKHLCRFQNREDGLVGVEQVRRVGGVLEHPADSGLWVVGGLPHPNEGIDRWGGWTIAVEQWWWGHRAVKPTWFYVVGTRDLPPIPTPSGERPPSGGKEARARDPKARSMLERLPKSQRHLTPDTLAAWLVEVASRCVAPSRAGAP
jgi:hypothetical protein